MQYSHASIVKTWRLCDNTVNVICLLCFIMRACGLGAAISGALSATNYITKQRPLVPGRDCLPKARMRTQIWYSWPEVETWIWSHSSTSGAACALGVNFRLCAGCAPTSGQLHKYHNSRVRRYVSFCRSLFPFLKCGAGHWLEPEGPGRDNNHHFVLPPPPLRPLSSVLVRSRQLSF